MRSYPDSPPLYFYGVSFLIEFGFPQLHFTKFIFDFNNIHINTKSKNNDDKKISGKIYFQ